MYKRQLFKQAGATPYVYDTNLDSADGNVITSNIIRATRFLGIYGRNKSQITIMVGTAAEEALSRNKSFQTMSAYAYGSGAGIFSGEIGKLNGSPVVATTFLDAQPGDTYGRCLIINNSAFAIGDWQQFSVQVFNEILAQTDQVAIRCRERIAFATRYPEAIQSIQNFPAQP